MLTQMHEMIKGWIAYVVIGLIGAAFVLWGVQYYVSEDRAEGKVLATVNGTKISESQLTSLVHRMQRNYTSQGKSLNQQVNAQIKMVALQNLVSQTMLSQAAEKNGFNVSKNQAQQIIMAIPEFQQNGQFSPQRLQQFLSASGLNQQQFLQQLQTNILLGQVSTGIQKSAFVLPLELETYYDLLYQLRNFSYVIVPASRFLSGITISDQQAKSYYDNNKSVFKLPEQVSVDYIELSPKTVSAGIQVSDEELKQSYQENIGSYRRPQSWKIDRINVLVTASDPAAKIEAARKKMSQLLASLKKGKSFDALMKQYQGTTETLLATAANSKLVVALKSLQPQQVSKSITTPQGYTIVRLVASTPASTVSFADAKDKIKAGLIRQKTQEKIASLNDTLTNLTYTSPDSLQPAAKALGVSVHTSALFSRQGSKTGVAVSPNVVTAAFSKSVLDQGNNSNPITLKDGSVVVLRVNKHVPSKVAPFTDVESKIKQSLADKTAQAKAALLANDLQAQIAAGKSPAELAGQNQLSWVTKTEVKREDKTIPAALLSSAFSLSLKKADNITTVALDNGDTALLQLNQVSNPDYSKLDDKAKQALAAGVVKFSGSMLYQMYVAGVKQASKIKMG